MGQCNYCSLKETRRRAEKSGKKVTTMPGMMGGIDTYVHEPEINIKELNKKKRKKYFVAWYMEVGTYCEC